MCPKDRAESGDGFQDRHKPGITIKLQKKRDMKKIKMKDTILSHYQKVHELEMDGHTVRVWKPRTTQQLPAYEMLDWIKYRAKDAISYMMMEQKTDWRLGNPDYGMWDAQTVYHYDPRNKSFDIYIAAILVRPYSREAYEHYCQTHENITDVNQRLMLLWDSREFDRIHGCDTSYGRPANMDEWKDALYHVVNEKKDIEDCSPDFYHKTEQRMSGLVVKLRDKDGNIDIEASWPKAEPQYYLPFVKDQMTDCFTAFDEFRKAHPDFHEMHFLTNQTVWEKDLEHEEEGA